MNYTTILSYLSTNIPGYVPFIMILTIVGIILIRAHFSSNRKFMIYDFIEDVVTGKGSLEKTGMLTAMLSITWWYISRSAEHTATYEDTLAYGAVMGLSKFADSFLKSKNQST